jgi:hypothetical protein
MADADADADAAQAALTRRQIELAGQQGRVTHCHFRETARYFGVTRSVEFGLGMDVLGSRSTRCTAARAGRTSRHSEALLRREDCDWGGDGGFAAWCVAYYGHQARLDTNSRMLLGGRRKSGNKASMIRIPEK